MSNPKYRRQDLHPHDVYFGAWQDYAFRERVFWGVVIGTLVLSAVMLLGGLNKEVVLPVLMGSMVVFGATWIWFSIFECPRCGRVWGIRGLGLDPFGTNCPRCNLPK